MKFASDYIVRVPAEYKKEFLNKVCKDNLFRMMVMAVLLVLAEPLVAFFAEIYRSDTYYLALGIAVFNLILLPILYYCRSKIENLTIFLIMTVQIIFAAGILSGGLLWSLFEQFRFASGSTYMLALYAISAFTVMPPLVSAILLFSFGLIFAYLLPQFQIVEDIMPTISINIYAMSALAWILNLMLYCIKIRDFHIEKSFVEKNRELEKVNNELKDMTMRDSMTDLLNHKSSMKRLNEEIDRARRIDYPLSVAMLDLDNFKAINDTYGHQTGDEILIQVARIIKDTCRTTDIVGRYGGEEFIIIMPDTDGKDAALLLNRIQARMMKAVCGDGIRVTFSCGISELNGDSVHGILKTSDFKLYEAKRKGKNRIEVQLNRNGKSAAIK